MTALHEASRSGDIDVITYLLKKGLNVNLVDNVSNITLYVPRSVEIRVVGIR